MTKYLYRDCPKCKDYLGVVVRDAPGPKSEIPIATYCIVCGFKLGWKLLRWTKFLFLLALLLVTGYSLLFAQSQIPATISIASWNIQQFGETKSSDPVRLARIAKVVKEFDVIAIQEIVHAPSQGQAVVDRLTLKLRNKHRRTYDHVLGPRTSCQGGREEQYAVLFDSEILEMVGSMTVADDPNATDNVCRDPLVVNLRMRNTAATYTFTLIVVHTDPDLAALTSDLNALGRIYQTVQARDQQDDDVILLGNLNAKPSRFQGLTNIPDLVYAIPDSGSMVRGASQNDNIVFQWAPTGEDYTGWSGVLRLARFLGISEHEAGHLSDHQPVFADFFTRQDSR